MVQFVKNNFNSKKFVIFLSLCESCWLYLVLYRFEVKFSLVLRSEEEGRVLYFNIKHLLDITSVSLIWLYIFLRITGHLVTIRLCCLLTYFFSYFVMDDPVNVDRNNYWEFRKIYRVLRDDTVRYKTVYFIRIKSLLR